MQEGHIIEEGGEAGLKGMNCKEVMLNRAEQYYREEEVVLLLSERTREKLMM